MAEEKLTKSELMDAIHKERARLEKALASFSEAQKAEKILENGWSVKDLMAHIAAWERVGFDIVQAARNSVALKTYVSKVFESIDNFNSKTYEKNKNKTLSKIEIEFQAAHKDFFTLIKTLDDDFITSNLPFDGADKLSVQYMISANTHLHYSEHTKALEALYM